MATSQNQGFIEQLREMRATRTQQLRQGGQQSTLLSRQITAMTTLNKTMEAVLRAQNSSTVALKDINNKQSNISKQNEQMSKSINNLASSITRSMGSMASAVGRGTVGAIGSAGGSVVGAASSVASGVASSLARMLPFAIAGVVGKMGLWDKMDDSVKKDLSDSFGNLVESLFGSVDTSGLKKVTAPITKEFGIVFGALGDTLSALVGKFENLPKRMEGSVKKIEESVEKIRETFDGLSKSFEKYGMKFEAAKRTVSDLVPNVDGVNLSGTVVAAGTAAAVVGGKKVYDVAKGTATTTTTSPPAAGAASKFSSASSPKMLSDKEMKVMQQSFDNMKKYGFKKDIFGLLAGRLITNYGGAFVQALIKYKVTGISAGLAAVSMALKYIEYSYISNEIDVMTENGYITDDEAKWLKGYIRTESFASVAGGIIVGTLGFVGGSFAGPVGSAAGGVLGTIAGDAAGADVGRATYELMYPMPETLKSTDYEQLYNDRVSKEKPQGAMSSPPASSSGGIFERFKGAIGRAETEGEADPYKAKNKAGSSASGKYQVIKGTFESYAKEKGSPVYGMTFEQFKNSPEHQEALMDYMLQDYNRILTAGKVPINEQTLYLSHVLSPETAVKVYNSDPNDDLRKYITVPGLYEKMIKQNPGLIEKGTTTGEIQLALGKRVSSRMNGNTVNAASVTSPTSPSSTDTLSFASTEPDTATTSTTYAENYARRRKEAKEAEKYEEGSETFVGPMLAKPSKLSAFASQFSIESFTSNFAEKTKELTDIVDSMFAAQTQSAPTIVADNSNVTNVINNSSGGSGGGPTMNQVVSTHMSNMNWQFNSMSGGVRA